MKDKQLVSDSDNKSMRQICGYNQTKFLQLSGRKE